MDHFAKLTAAFALAFAGSAYAGYAQMKPPPGWAPGTYAPSANDSTFGRVIHSPNGPTTIVAGQAVKMPAAYRLAANAPRIAASALFMHPGIRAAVGIASWLNITSIVWDEATQQWEKITKKYVDGYVYYISGSPTLYSSAQAACNSYPVITGYSGWTPFYNGTEYATGCKATHPHPAMYPEYRSLWSYKDTTEQASKRPLTKEEFERELAPDVFTPGAPSIMPETVPLELPQPTPLPVELPWINPSPGPNPQHQPLFVPTGDPVPNPNFNPNSPVSPSNLPYMQPGVRVVPSPTPTEPWRVDIQPVNRPQENPNPNPEPGTEPGTDPADKPKPEEQQSLCEKHPDIVACAKLGEPGQATPVPNETKTLTIAPENGFGPSGGSCPPPRTVQVAGLTLSMPFDLLCDFATGLKPVIVGLAWLTAAFTFMGIGRRS